MESPITNATVREALSLGTNPELILLAIIYKIRFSSISLLSPSPLLSPSIFLLLPPSLPPFLSSRGPPPDSFHQSHPRPFESRPRLLLQLYPPSPPLRLLALGAS